MRLFFDPDLAMSYREMTANLRSAARFDRALERLAISVSDRYASALMSNDAQRPRAWKAFITSLHAFLALTERTGRYHAELRSIVDENADLLEFDSDVLVASG